MYVPAPAGIAVGDLIVLVVAWYRPSTLLTLPSLDNSWNNISEAHRSDGYSHVAVFTRFYTGELDVDNPCRVGVLNGGVAPEIAYTFGVKSSVSTGVVRARQISFNLTSTGTSTIISLQSNKVIRNGELAVGVLAQNFNNNGVNSFYIPGQVPSTSTYRQATNPNGSTPIINGYYTHSSIGMSLFAGMVTPEAAGDMTGNGFEYNFQSDSNGHVGTVIQFADQAFAADSGSAGGDTGLPTEGSPPSGLATDFITPTSAVGTNWVALALSGSVNSLAEALSLRDAIHTPSAAGSIGFQDMGSTSGVVPTLTVTWDGSKFNDLPSNATITGLGVFIARGSLAGAASDNDFKLIYNGSNSINKSNFSTWPPMQGNYYSAEYEKFGTNYSDTWGLSIDTATLKSNGISLAMASVISSGDQLIVDGLVMRVYYTTDGGGGDPPPTTVNTTHSYWI